MINPFLNMEIKGVLWYQGEQNSGSPQNYTCYFPAMIEWWRGAFKQQFTFLFVQLSTILPPQIRQAQLAALVLPSVGFATAADLGDNLSPWGSIHPRDKQDVGRRLTLAARNIAYGETSVVWQGPVYQSANVSSDGNTSTIDISFKLFGTGSFTTKAPECPAGLATGICGTWGLYDSLGRTYTNNITVSKIDGNVVSVQITEPNVKIVGVSYGWADWPLLTLYSEQDLPAIPFYANPF